MTYAKNLIHALFVKRPITSVLSKPSHSDCVLKTLRLRRVHNSPAQSLELVRETVLVSQCQLLPLCCNQLRRISENLTRIFATACHLSRCVLRRVNKAHIRGRICARECGLIRRRGRGTREDCAMLGSGNNGRAPITGNRSGTDP